jgi:hypothetical protein
MASLLNNASLLLNPAGSIIAYEEDKILSVLPSNGTGDFTFSGGDGGTRVNQQGYIEITPFNWFNYSNALNTSPWSMNVTGGQTGKDGVANAWLLTKASPTTSDYYTVKPNDGVQTVSFYVKKESNKGIKPYAIGSVTLEATINIETGAVISKSSGVDVVVETYNSSWWRIHVTANVINSFWYWYVTDAAGTQIASTVTLQDMQLVYGAFIKPYQPTTDRLNYPRITYQNGKGALMGEPQRTNVLTNSQNLSLCLPSQANTTVTADATLSPDGTQNADSILFAASSYRLQTTSIVSGTSYSPSIFVKNNDFAAGEYFVLNLSDGVVGGMNVYIYPASKTITVNSGAWSNVSGRIVPYNNDWFRVELSGTANNTGTGWYEIYTGTAKSVYLWGMQLESVIISFNPQTTVHATSYIPTTSATVTRIKDQYSRSINSQPTGSVLVNIPNNIPNGGDGTHVYGFFLLAGASNLGLSLNRSNNTRNRLWTYAASVIYTTTADNLKLGITWDGTYINVWQNGVKVVTNYAYALTNISTIESSTNIDTVQSLSQIALYSDILSNTQLTELTTVRSGSGGNISYYGPYTIHTFTGSATFTPSFTGPVEVLVVAGGGSGAAGWGNGGGMGGGGAGGLLYASSYSVAANTGITVTIGAGGAGTTGTTQSGRNGTLRGNPGSNTAFGGLTALGGGGGAGDGATANTIKGGSGGGGGYQAILTGGIGTPGQGNNGGDHSNANGYPGNYCGGGGGGAGAVGTPGTTAGGNGGVGLPYSISGFSTYYAGGGGGGTYATTGPGGAGIGGLGGGGNGGLGTTNPGQNGTPGVDYIGGAGGAGGCPGSSPNIGGNGGAGGSGVVIVRYLT